MVLFVVCTMTTGEMVTEARDDGGEFASAVIELDLDDIIFVCDRGRDRVDNI